MDNYFPKKFQKISGQEDNQISIFGCPHSIFGRRGHEELQILLPCMLNILKHWKFFNGSITFFTMWIYCCFCYETVILEIHCECLILDTSVRI